MRPFTRATVSLREPLTKPRMTRTARDRAAWSTRRSSVGSGIEKLTKINKWYCEELAYLAKRLAETPEPGGEGSLLDNTTIVWTNELGKGNSHTLDNIPFVLVGGGLGFRMGRSHKFKRAAHNRLLMSLAHGFGHHIKTFGKPEFCGDGPLALG